MFVGLLVLIVLAVAALQFHGVQKYIAQKAVSFISEKTNTRIEIGSVNIAFTHSVVIKDIFIESRQQDTLLSVQSLAVDVNLLGLFSNEINLTNISIDSLTTHITRTLPDSSFNFDFVLNALSSESNSVKSDPDTSTKSNWKIQFGRINLQNIYATYDDEVSGLDLNLRIGVLDASIDEFDLDRMQFSADKISLQNTTASIIQLKDSPPDTSTSQTVTIGIGFGSISIVDSRFNYKNNITAEQYYADFGTSLLVGEKIDLASRKILLKKFLLENSSIVIVQAKKDTVKTKESVSTVMPWVMSLDQLTLTDNTVQYDVLGEIKTKVLDLNHLQLNGLTIRAENIYFSEKRIVAEIGQIYFQERSGIELRNLSGGFFVDSVHTQISDFTVETKSSRIHQNLLLNYSSLSELKNLAGTVNITATIDDSHVDISEILYFLPTLPIKDSVDASIKFSSKLSGTVQDLMIEEFFVSVGDSTTLDLTGSIHGLPEIETAEYHVNLNHFTTGRNDIQRFVVDTLLPKEIILPASISVSGNFNGTLKNFSASTFIETSFGKMNANAELNSKNKSKESQWKVNAMLEKFNVGLLLNDTATFGPVSLNASAIGTGLSKDDINAKLKIRVEKIVLNGYPYKDLTIDGIANATMFEGKAEIKDSNIAFIFNGIINTSEENPNYKFTFDLLGADLQRLNITQDDIRVSGKIKSDLVGQNVDDINGNFDVRQVVIIKNNKRYVIDSLVYVSVNIEDQTHISIESPVVAGQFDGTISLTNLPDVLKEHFSHYFSLQSENPTGNQTLQEFSFQVDVRDPSTLTDIFFPELRQLSVGTIKGHFNNILRDLSVTIELPRIKYGDIVIDSLSFLLKSDSLKLHTALNVKSISDSTFHISNLHLGALAENDSINVILQSSRNDGFMKMYLAGVFNSVVDGYKFRFNENGIIFQNVAWNIPSDNFISFAKKKFFVNNIVMQGAGQSLSVGSADETNERSPLRIEFNNFDLSTLSQIVERKRGWIGGILNGNVILQNFEKQMAFTSDMTIKNFTFTQMTIGDITLHANNQTENLYEVNVDISGNGNQISLVGKYRSVVGGSELDMKLNFTTMNLATIEPFTFGNVQRLSGTMTGSLNMIGTLKKPVITGELNFSNAAFNPKILDSYLRLNRGRIVFDDKGIDFTSFDLVDTLGNVASLSGHLLTDDFREFKYDFKIKTNNFLVLNKPFSRDALYYGTVILDSDISVKGDKEKQIVNVSAELEKGTDLAVVLPESELVVEERKGIVRFVNKKIPLNSIMQRRNPRSVSDTTDAKLSTMELTSNITVNKDSKLRILIDPISGDSLVIRGEATMSFTVDPSGKITLTGRYEILDGSYQLSFGDFIRREFAIAKGSSLTWFGSPFDAEVDITAIYTVKTTVLDLIQDQLTGISQEERNKYKQEIPIQVYLMMKGKLLTPDIHFKLDLPPDKRGVLSGTVYAKLNELNGQESELNKQVFALLVLGRFISESPLASSGGNGNVSGFARSSASQILSEQLNRLSKEYISGVDLNVGVESYEDYSSGNAEGRTELQLALSKQLFNERMTVQVGGNVDLEGQRSQKNSLNNFAGDLKVMYKLTEDGRWQMQVFRQNTYEGAIDGEITKTGAGIVYTIDFNKLLGFTLKPVLD